jgi:hypothetical protein
MDITGRITWVVCTALFVFFVVKYLFPLTGAFIDFLVTFFSHVSKAAFGA